MKRIFTIRFTLSLFLAILFPVIESKCSTASLNIEHYGKRTLAYVCIHGDLTDLNDVPSEAEWIEFTVARLHLVPDGAFSRFSQLRRLTFYNCELRDFNLNAFRGLKNLEWLVMSNTKLNVARTEMFKHIPNLKMLTLDSTGLMYIEPEVFRILSKRLEVLSIRNNDLDCLPIDGLLLMERLRTVRIDENPWLCDCRRALLSFFSDRKINLDHSVQDLSPHHHRRKRWHTTSHNESFYSSSSYQSSATKVYKCMAVLEYPLPSLIPTQNYSVQPKYNEYSHHEMVEWREITTNTITYLDRLPDEMGWIELYDIHIPTIKRYTFFRFGNNLRSLILKNCGIEYIEPEAFAGLHKLERLAIIGARFPVVSNYWFRDLQRLTDLILEHDSIERFEYGSLDYLRNLKRLNLRMNRLNCLPSENLKGLLSLGRIEAGENPWYCSCRQNLENYLISKRIGYEISNSRADGVGCIDDHGATPITRPTNQIHDFYNFTSNGRIRWSWGYETHTHRPSQRPPTPAPTYPPMELSKPTRIPTTTTINYGGCRSAPSQHYHHHQRYSHLTGLTYVCSRGSLSELLTIPATVETIIFSDSDLRVLTDNSFRKFNGFLKRLEFRNCVIHHIGNEVFSNLYNLESLVIRRNDLDTVKPEWFTNLRNLKHLDLADNNIGRIDKMVFDYLPYLESLDISDNSLNCIGIEHLEKLKRLKELNVAGNPWTCLCATRLWRLIQDQRIQCSGSCLNDVLHGDGLSSYGGCHSTGGFTPGLEATKRPPPATSPPTSTTPSYPVIPVPAEYSNASGTCYSTHENSHYHCYNGDLFVTSKIPNNVRSIEIYDSFIPYIPASSFSRFENLTELILRNCSIRDIDPRAFNGLHRLEKLLIKTNNRLSFVRSDWFKHCRNIYWLDLSSNNLIEIENGAFDNLKQLQYLNLENNAFQCIYTSYFIQLPRLDTLEFGRNPLKWRCYQDLRQFLEIRAIGYTYYKCPHDSRALVKTLQDDKKLQAGASTSSATNQSHNIIKNILVTITITLFIFIY